VAPLETKITIFPILSPTDDIFDITSINMPLRTLFRFCRVRPAHEEVGSNISTGQLQVVRGDEKGIQCWGAYPDHPVSGGYKYEDLVLQVGEVPNLRQ
jgi:hypothetical protein